VPSDPQLEPIQITPFPNGELGIAWADGHESFYGGKYLRCACACAGCVDEVSGVKTLQDDTVPEDTHVVSWSPVGNYAIHIVWSDGHDGGIYSFRHLRSLCPCGACAKESARLESPPSRGGKGPRD
jgi:DUF971 family protein